jgi:hypothetical protein
VTNDTIGVELIDKIIAQFCGEVIAEPLCFFNEGDLQGFLFAKLVDHFQEPIETSVRRGPSSKGSYKTGLVHREYGVGARHRMDIVIFSADDVRKITSPTLRVGKKYLTPRFGIELGTEKTTRIESHLRHDINKVKDVSERGYLLFFFRDTTSADVGTKSRGETEAKIERILRKPFESHDVPPNVKVLCFLLRLARRHKKIFGKCEIYDPEAKRWEKVNLRSVRNRVLGILGSPLI